MGMHEPGWRRANEERAWESWRETAQAHVAALRAAAQRIEDALLTTGHARAIADAVQDADEASNELFKMREGPEPPE